MIPWVLVWAMETAEAGKVPKSCYSHPRVPPFVTESNEMPLHTLLAAALCNVSIGHAPHEHLLYRSALPEKYTALQLAALVGLLGTTHWEGRWLESDLVHFEIQLLTESLDYGELATELRDAGLAEDLIKFVLKRLPAEQRALEERTAKIPADVRAWWKALIQERQRLWRERLVWQAEWEAKAAPLHEELKDAWFSKRPVADLGDRFSMLRYDYVMACVAHGDPITSCMADRVGWLLGEGIHEAAHLSGNFALTDADSQRHRDFPQVADSRRDVYVAGESAKAAQRRDEEIRRSLLSQGFTKEDIESRLGPPAPLPEGLFDYGLPGLESIEPSYVDASFSGTACAMDRYFDVVAGITVQGDYATLRWDSTVEKDVVGKNCRETGKVAAWTFSGNRLTPIYEEVCGSYVTETTVKRRAPTKVPAADAAWVKVGDRVRVYSCGGRSYVEGVYNDKERALVVRGFEL